MVTLYSLVIKRDAKQVFVGLFPLKTHALSAAYNLRSSGCWQALIQPVALSMVYIPNPKGETSNDPETYFLL